MGTHVSERDNYVRDFVMVEQSALRRRLEAAIERMIDVLDQLDRDPDFESDNDNEPWLGAPEVELPSSASWIAERDRYGSQAEWAAGGRDDYEDDPAELGIGDAGGLCEQARGEGERT